MYQANVYKIMIGAPSDIQYEIQIACQVINKWNNINSESKQLILLPLHWSISSYPTSGLHPQKIINQQLIEKSDSMICFFGTKLGTATDTDISGTVEEINEHIRAGKHVMVFFRNQIDAHELYIEQFRKLEEYKRTIQDKVLWVDYNNEQDLESMLFDKLSLFVNDNWQGYKLPQILSSLEKYSQLDLSDWDKERLNAWVNSGEIEGWFLDFSGWSRNYILGRVQYCVTKSEEILEWDDFFERMQNIGFITLDRYDRNGVAVYRLKKAAFDFVKNYCKD
jgi:hypothetical protein